MPNLNITISIPRLESALTDISQNLQQLRKELLKDMSQLDDNVAALAAEVANETSVEKSAVALLTGIPQMIADAVAKAIAAGATPAQLQAITDLNSTLKANDDELAAAVAANTPAAPPA